MEGPGELHHDGGGVQGRTPFHDPLEDLHEQQFGTAKAGVNGTERLPDEGPSALVDLFTVTLGIREHRYALTKDLSKFYQRVDAEPLAQHLRRVMWRGGDATAEMKVYITTTVNFGDKPAGCIAIAAARETAERFGAKFTEAAWFLKFRTYVDDAITGADTMARLEELSSEMEAVARQGGFEFKETLMSGDKEKDDGEPHKVLGLIWETEKDRLRVDVKLNLGAIRAGLHLLGNVELEDEPEKALPGVITKRELWRVAQGQYDPLGLLCGYTVRFKVLMRSLAEESTGRVVGWDKPVPEGTNKEFREVVKHLADLRAITPEGGQAARASHRQAHTDDLRGRIYLGKLRAGVPEVADGRRISTVPPPSRQDEGGAQVQDIHSQDGAGPGLVGSEAGTQDN